jgi:hypothetical protein
MSEEEKNEVTEENPEVKDTPEPEAKPEVEPKVEEKPTEEKETPKEQTKESYTDREKRYYARMKESDEIAKKAKADLAKAKEETAKAKLPISDVDAILEVQNATKGLDADEVAELKLRASSLGVSLSEARENKNYQLWQGAHRKEVEKEKALAPNTNQEEVDKPKTLEEELAAAKNEEERGKVMDLTL